MRIANNSGTSHHSTQPTQKTRNLTNRTAGTMFAPANVTPLQLRETTNIQAAATTYNNVTDMTKPEHKHRTTAPIRYPGSKWSIANQIISHFPQHYHYIEPYFGSGAVFFTKPPSPHELINDTCGTVTNFFQTLRDHTDELLWLLENTPWSREEYDNSTTITNNQLENARRFVVRVWQAHASDLSKKTGWKNRGHKQRARGMSIRWQRVPSELAQIAHRLQDAEIESRPAVDIMKRFSGNDCLIYADPPYLPSTRTQKMYAQEMTENDHIEMLQTLKAHNGPAVLSGYNNELYNTLLPDWTKTFIKPPKVEKAATRLETLWIKNPADQNLSTTYPRQLKLP